ncbi:hypothetical protein ADUPG1_003853 [Aduncisulcus paluster]|uniref:Uncharacterized protein n=1 Tax=Aduncisulcus paluster TaxID=2918883 RepID=A0ABQ5L3E0_9EUKA|nr:hypothetical protein ADUPG1_003853 [Aduncisulcus paluster]
MPLPTMLMEMEVTFDNNSAGGNGGCLDTDGVTAFEVIAGQFDHNSAGGKGGDFHFTLTMSLLMNPDYMILDAEFSGSSAGSDGGSIYLTVPFVNISGCSFTNCSSGGSGGAVYLTKPKGVFSSSYTQLDLSGTEFKNCSAVQYAGGLYTEYLIVDLQTAASPCTFNQCTCGAGGCGMMAEDIELASWVGEITQDVLYEFNSCGLSSTPAYTAASAFYLQTDELLLYSDIDIFLSLLAFNNCASPSALIGTDECTSSQHEVIHNYSVKCIDNDVWDCTNGGEDLMHVLDSDGDCVCKPGYNDDCTAPLDDYMRETIVPLNAGSKHNRNANFGAGIVSGGNMFGVIQEGTLNFYAIVKDIDNVTLEYIVQDDITTASNGSTRLASASDWIVAADSSSIYAYSLDVESLFIIKETWFTLSNASLVSFGVDPCTSYTTVAAQYSDDDDTTYLFMGRLSEDGSEIVYGQGYGDSSYPGITCSGLYCFAYGNTYKNDPAASGFMFDEASGEPVFIGGDWDIARPDDATTSFASSMAMCNNVVFLADPEKETLYIYKLQEVADDIPTPVLVSTQQFIDTNYYGLDIKCKDNIFMVSAQYVDTNAVSDENSEHYYSHFDVWTCTDPGRTLDSLYCSISNTISDPTGDSYDHLFGYPDGSKHDGQYPMPWFDLTLASSSDYIHDTVILVGSPGNGYVTDEGAVYSFGYVAPTPITPDDDNGLPGWAIALIIIGSIIVVAAVVILIVYCVKKSPKGETTDLLGKGKYENLSEKESVGEEMSSPKPFTLPDLESLKEKIIEIGSQYAVSELYQISSHRLKATFDEFSAPSVPSSTILSNLDFFVLCSECLSLFVRHQRVELNYWDKTTEVVNITLDISSIRNLIDSFLSPMIKILSILRSEIRKTTDEGDTLASTGKKRSTGSKRSLGGEKKGKKPSSSTQKEEDKVLSITTSLFQIISISLLYVSSLRQTIFPQISGLLSELFSLGVLHKFDSVLVENILEMCKNFSVAKENTTKDALLTIISPSIHDWIKKYKTKKSYLLWMTILKNISFDSANATPNKDRCTKLWFTFHLILDVVKGSSSVNYDWLKTSLIFFANLCCIPDQGVAIFDSIKTNLLDQWHGIMIMKYLEEHEWAGIGTWANIVSIFATIPSLLSQVSPKYDVLMNQCQYYACQEYHSRYIAACHSTHTKWYDLYDSVAKALSPALITQMYEDNRDDILGIFSKIISKSDITEHKEEIRLCCRCLSVFIAKLPQQLVIIDTFLDHLERIDEIQEGIVDRAFCNLCYEYSSSNIHSLEDSFLRKISPMFQRILKRGSKEKLPECIARELLFTLFYVSASTKDSILSSLFALISPYCKYWFDVNDYSECYGIWMMLLSNITASKDSSLCSEVWPLFYPVFELIEGKFDGIRFTMDNHEYVLEFLSNLCYDTKHACIIYRKVPIEEIEDGEEEDEEDEEDEEEEEDLY